MTDNDPRLDRRAAMRALLAERGDLLLVTAVLLAQRLIGAKRWVK